jgi:hypothetical protein
LGRWSEPEKLSVVGDDEGRQVRHGEQVDLRVLVGGADGDVAQPAELTKGDFAGGGDFVAPDAVVGGRRLLALHVTLSRCSAESRSQWDVEFSLIERGFGLRG